MEKDERLEAIQLIREEIKWLADMAGWVKCEHMGACQRVLKREHAALNFLQEDAAFTRVPLEAIRLIEEEIHCISYYREFQVSAGAKDDSEILARILAKLQDALKSLQQGMTDGKEGV